MYQANNKAATLTSHRVYVKPKFKVRKRSRICLLFSSWFVVQMLKVGATGGGGENSYGKM